MNEEYLNKKIRMAQKYLEGRTYYFDDSKLVIGEIYLSKDNHIVVQTWRNTTRLDSAVPDCIAIDFMSLLSINPYILFGLDLYI